MSDGLDQKIAQYGRRLYGLCVKLCGNPYDADDLYQETWLRVCSKYRRYDPSQPFEPWLTAVCVNAYRDSLRRRKFEKLIAAFDDDESRDKAMNSVGAGECPDENAELWAAVEKLPEKYRTVVILHYFRGYDVKELSFILKAPEGTVKYRLHRARELLKGELSP
jgi:RNA polymerase sigma factor, sigma-70 family